MWLNNASLDFLGFALLITGFWQEDSATLLVSIALPHTTGTLEQDCPATTSYAEKYIFRATQRGAKRGKATAQSLLLTLLRLSLSLSL